MVTFFHPCFYVHLLTNDAPFFFQNFKVARFLNISSVEDIKKRDDAFFLLTLSVGQGSLFQMLYTYIRSVASNAPSILTPTSIVEGDTTGYLVKERMYDHTKSHKRSFFISIQLKIVSLIHSDLMPSIINSRGATFPSKLLRGEPSLQLTLFVRMLLLLDR